MTLVQKLVFFRHLVMKRGEKFMDCWGQTARKTTRSENFVTQVHKNLWKWWNFRKFHSWMQKIFQNIKCNFSKSARKQLPCILWCYKTHAADYNDLLRPLYHWIWVMLHFAVSEREKMSHFFKNDIEIRMKIENQNSAPRDWSFIAPTCCVSNMKVFEATLGTSVFIL